MPENPIQPQVPLKIPKAGPSFLLLLLFILLGLGSAGGLFFFFTHKGEKAPSGAKRPQTAAPAPQPAPPPVVEVIEPPPSQETGLSLSGGPAQERPLPALTLSGILYSGNGSLALINGHVVREGGLVEGARLEKVASDRVELIFDNKRIVLRAR